MAESIEPALQPGEGCPHLAAASGDAEIGHAAKDRLTQDTSPLRYGTCGCGAIVAGHDVVHTPLDKRAELLARDGVLPPELLVPITAGLRETDDEIVPVAYDGTEADTARRMGEDLTAFRDRRRLARVVVVNVSSTEPAVRRQPEHADLAALELAFFFKDPLGSDEHRFADQARQLYRWARRLG